MPEFDTDSTDNIICPYCGYEDYDSWESGDGEEEFDETCGNCGKEMHVTRHYTVSYSSKKLEAHHDFPED
ncbi:hypothetical protein FOH24_07220 [Acetobacter tropicalis]|uniref:hypothetical protein n=1 Tax=Acetobacter tropicalis TaxID=104102 RepID=UPI0009DCEF14|nr:hypothetical protein [Acetobacter tropicalis]KAA8387078.1 hypothetical protein FOH22_10565 [Acetobacter tropicalis]KAA8391423.1 hypothetical protein FOH24_07220 [Acetobacter tropicalis]MBC9009950.1 hypothetical protein [Acetobacter tropicalis]MDO8171926.1 hypothetical protein [Acetobacter tropicalis]